MDRTHTIDSTFATPGAGSQIERIGPTCLDVRARTENFWTGIGGGGWGWLWMILCFSAFGQIVVFVLEGAPWEPGNSWAAHFQIHVWLLPLVLALKLVVPIWVWRKHLPVRFNRRTREVSMELRGKVYTVPWDELAGRRRDLTGFTFPGVVLHDQLLQIDFPDGKGGTLKMLINGQDHHKGARVPDGPEALWAYITVYMEQGPDALPGRTPRGADYIKPSEFGLVTNPLPIFTARNPLLWPLQLFVSLPLVCLFLVTAIPTSLIHYWLYTSIPRQPMPEAMFDPENDDPSVLAGNSRPPGITQKDMLDLWPIPPLRGGLFVSNRAEVEEASQALKARNARNAQRLR
ncbi:DUF6708 domain-containing protein [Aquisalimonas asiatica]|uniref:DUF6708 domain-containing protein n=1 Tax=Aquisalimonas asiatica TaxID=406100 RepID=A0A1H8SAA9_9GAMM|nr:hypothetical protein [Aquisalimonas asiatica]SEO75525.1 hypothetical protein SAMN04488052_102631 [Aquisalimonas asiatica]